MAREPEGSVDDDISRANGERFQRLCKQDWNVLAFLARAHREVSIGLTGVLRRSVKITPFNPINLRRAFHENT